MRNRIASRAAVAAACVLGACDFPTELPIVETRFVIPAESTTLRVDELLPGTVGVAGDAFTLAVEPTAIPPRTLGQMCGTACAPLQGIRVPKPAFTYSFDVAVDVPDDVVSATIVSGAVRVELTHTFGFDPLQPAGSASGGFIALEMRNGTRVIARDTLRGAFPSGSTVVRTLPITSGAVTGDLDLGVTISSPAGGTAPANWVTVDNNAAFSGMITPQQLEISTATIAVADRDVDVDAVTLDLSGLDESTRDRVKRGALVLEISNPFNVSGPLTLQLTGGTAGVVTKTVQLAAGATSHRIEFTDAELRSLLGQVVAMNISGPVTAAGGTVTVVPGQQLTVVSRFDLVFEIGS